MILPFSQQFPWGEPTHFMEKIWACKAWLDRPVIEKKPKFDLYKLPLVDPFMDVLNFKKFNPKLHTIRELGNRNWQYGRLIHAYYNNRQPNMVQICPTFRCKSTQFIIIEYRSDLPIVYINEKKLTPTEVETLAINDGFTDSSQFFRWFNKYFEGEIIHWTDLRY